LEEKIRKGVLLTREERFLAWLGAFLLIASIAMQFLAWCNITPPDTVAYSQYIVLVLLFAGISLASFLIGRKSKKFRLETQTVQKGRFYSSREELPKLLTFLSQAEQEIFVVGTTLHAIVGSNREMIRDFVKGGITVRLLFLDPKSKLLGMLSDCLVGDSDYSKTIPPSLETACSVKRELADIEKNRLDIRTYDTIPFYTMLMLDPNTGNGVVRIEPYFYKKGERARSSFEIYEKDQKEEFQKHRSGYDYLMRISKEYQCS